jgi:hypothetical protein
MKRKPCDHTATGGVAKATCGMLEPLYAGQRVLAMLRVSSSHVPFTTAIHTCRSTVGAEMSGGGSQSWS